VTVLRGAVIKDSIIMDDVKIGPGAVVNKTVIDKRVKVPQGMQIGCNKKEDKKLFSLTPGGVCVVPQNMPL
ncbi:MAG: glucose-1-phosphate adenylyltransferase, partial [Fibrobacteria bacterium]|nr:glucose-1-phosphate adenylyltransferase [Fibrobacteria bacterium]